MTAPTERCALLVGSARKGAPDRDPIETQPCAAEAQAKTQPSPARRQKTAHQKRKTATPSPARQQKERDPGAPQGALQGPSRVPPGAPQGASRGPPGGLQGPSRGAPGALQGHYRGPPGGFQGPSREPPGALQGPSKGPPGALQGSSRGPPGVLRGASRESQPLGEPAEGHPGSSWHSRTFGLPGAFGIFERALPGYFWGEFNPKSGGNLITFQRPNL